MKILLAHNDYAKYSGEEAVVDKMAAIFKSLGHEVVSLRKSTAGDRDNLAGKLKVFAAGINCPSGVRSMKEILEREKPDVVNIHNLYPFISPAALQECRRRGVLVVMTVHNYRLLCPTGLFMRENRPCELCLEKGNEWNCMKYNCEGSLPKSISYALRNMRARLRRDYIDCVDFYACLTDFQRQKLIQGGFPAERIVVIPNPIDHPERIQKSETRGDYIGYCGRLSREKGIDLVLEVARRNPDISFKLAGSVRDEKIIENLPSNVSLTGYLQGEELDEFYQKARFMVMASRWYEGFPMTVLEAGMHGKAMLAPAHGGFPEILDDDPSLLFNPGDTDSLEMKIRNLWDNPELTESAGRELYRKVKEEYNINEIARKWENLLNTVIKNKNCEKKGSLKKHTGEKKGNE